MVPGVAPTPPAMPMPDMAFVSPPTSPPGGAYGPAGGGGAP